MWRRKVTGALWLGLALAVGIPASATVTSAGGKPSPRVGDSPAISQPAAPISTARRTSAWIRPAASSVRGERRISGAAGAKARRVMTM